MTTTSVSAKILEKEILILKYLEVSRNIWAFILLNGIKGNGRKDKSKLKNVGPFQGKIRGAEIFFKQNKET